MPGERPGSGPLLRGPHNRAHTASIRRALVPLGLRASPLPSPGTPVLQEHTCMSTQAGSEEPCEAQKSPGMVCKQAVRKVTYKV